MAERDVKVLINGDASGLFKALGESSLAMKNMGKELEGTFAGLKSVFSNLAAPLMAITAVVGGKEFLKGTIDETKNWTVEAQKLARVLGITTEQASVLNLAIGDIYGTQEEYLGAVAKLTKTLNTNEEAFHRLGVATRDQNGRLRDTPTLMAEVNSKLLEMNDGTARNVASARIYGKSWMEVQRYLKLTPEVIAEAQAKAERLNLIVGSDAVAATEAYRASMNDLEDTVKALKISIGNQLMPVMTTLNTIMSDAGPDAVRAIKDEFRDFTWIASILAKGLSRVQSYIDGMINIAPHLKTFVQELGQASSLKEVGAAWDKLKLFNDAVKQTVDEQIRDMDTEVDLFLDKLDGKTGNSGPQQEKKQGKDPGKNKDDQDKEFEELKARAERYKYYIEASAQERGEYREATKAQEAAYWKNLLDTADLGEKTRAKVQQEYYKAARAELKKHHDETKALDDSYRERYVAEQKALLDEEEKAVEQALAQGKITEQQGLDWKRAIERDKYELELSALKDRLAVKGLEPIEISKIHGQIEALEAQHNAKMAELSNQQALLDRQKDGWAGWSEGIRESLLRSQNHFANFKQAAIQMYSGIENAFANGIQGILSGQMTLRQGLKAIWQGIVQTITQAVAQIAAQWLIGKIIGKYMAEEQAGQSSAVTAAALTAGAANAWQAWGWIPYIGAGLAMAQIALMEASVAGVGAMGAASKAFAGGSSAEGGEDVVGAAEGGWFDRPTKTVMGEGWQRELAVPEVTFKDFAYNLASNILAQERQAQDYGRLATGYARSSIGAPGAAGAAPLVQHIAIHAPIWDPSQRGLRGMGESLVDAMRASGYEREVVLRPGYLGSV